LLLKHNRGQDIFSARRENPPSRELSNTIGSFVYRKRLCDLARDNYEEFL
jgi:hypothetical protein